MEYRPLGRSGCVVSVLSLGTMTFGLETDEAGASRSWMRSWRPAARFIDTADVYAGTESEAIIGRWLSSAPTDVREQVVLATKARFPTGEGPNDLGLSRRHLSTALDASLRRLQLDTIDLYQVHAWDPADPAGGDAAVPRRRGRGRQDPVRGAVQLHRLAAAAAVDLAEFHGWSVPVTLQPHYNLLGRELEWEIVPACAANGLGILPWSPLAGGWLTGKYRPDERPTGASRLGEDPDRGLEAYDRRSAEQRTWDVIDAVRTVADGRGVSMAQVALAWVADRPQVTSVILGARTQEQLADNLGAAGLHLDEEETALLDGRATRAPAGYPYGGPGVEQRSRDVRGRR
jgi:aryl-alcohol dehydrogenase-like predicted oxidoreductase